MPGGMQVVGKRVDFSLQDERGERCPRTQIVTLEFRTASRDEAVRDKFEECFTGYSKLKGEQLCNQVSHARTYPF